MSLPKGLWSYYTHLLNATGYTDLVKGHELPICQCQAQLEAEVLTYAYKNHKMDIAEKIWEDMKERPNFWAVSLGTASAVGTVSKVGKAAIKAATPAKTKGSSIDIMSSKINNFTGCY